MIADVEASPAELHAIDEAFRRIGVDVSSLPAYEMRSAGSLPWVVHITLAAPIAAFFTAVATEAGKDTYALVKQWVRDLLAARAESTRPTGSITVVDTDATTVVVSAGLSDEAIDALSALDWSAVRGDYLIWDEETAAWYDPTKRLD